MLRTIIMIDGGHVRACARRANHKYDPDFIERVALNSLHETESPIRVLYYDCAPFEGSIRLPVSRTNKTFSGNPEWLRELARKNLFAVRLGELKIRGFERKHPLEEEAGLTDDGFRPVFEQKGVDMRIGLDIASYSANRGIDRIILMSGDSDCVPAMKHARKAGVQVVIVEFPNSNLVSLLKEHADFVRPLAWPL